MQIKQAIMLSVSLHQLHEYESNGFQFDRADPEDAQRMLVSKTHNKPLRLDHHVGTSAAYIAPYQIRRPQTAYEQSPLTEALDERMVTSGAHIADSLERIEAVRFAYSIAKVESIAVTVGTRRFALRIYSRFAASDLLTYIQYLARVRTGEQRTQSVNSFTRSAFSDNTLPSAADMWWDATHDAFFTFDKNYATRLPRQLDREIEWRKNRR